MDAHDHTPHSVMFSLAVSIYCYIVSSYAHPIIGSLGFWDELLTYGVKGFGIIASMATTASFYFKYEKKLIGIVNKIKGWFI